MEKWQPLTFHRAPLILNRRIPGGSKFPDSYFTAHYPLEKIPAVSVSSKRHVRALLVMIPHNRLLIQFFHDLYCVTYTVYIQFSQLRQMYLYSKQPQLSNGLYRPDQTRQLKLRTEIHRFNLSSKPRRRAICSTKNKLGYDSCSLAYPTVV